MKKTLKTGREANKKMEQKEMTEWVKLQKRSKTNCAEN